MFAKAVSITSFTVVIILSTLCIYWLRTFWKCRNTVILKLRRPLIIVISYVIILPLVSQESISTIYGYVDNKDTHSTYLKEQIPIFYSITLDSILHYLFWFVFWSFVQLKIFKLWMLRYGYEYKRNMQKLEWKNYLYKQRKDTIYNTSIFIRYKHILGNDKKIISLQLIILFITMIIQITIRELTDSQINEQIFVIFICSLQLTLIAWSTLKISGIDDNLYILLECKKEVILSTVTLILYALSLIIWSVTHNKVDFIWYRVITNILLILWLSCFCYLETKYILKHCKLEIIQHNVDVNLDYEDDAYPQYNYSSDHYGFGDVVDRNERNHRMKLYDLLQTKQGFELFMKHLICEFSMECLLSYLEFTQYINLWFPISNIFKYDKKLYLPLIWGYIRLIDNEYNFYIPDDITLLIIYYFKYLYKPSKRDHDNQYVDTRFMLNKFPYLEKPEFDDSSLHFDYLTKKYIVDMTRDDIYPELEINIEWELKNTIKVKSNPNTEYLANRVRKTMWTLLNQSFSRFQCTKQYIECNKLKLATQETSGKIVAIMPNYKNKDPLETAFKYMDISDLYRDTICISETDDKPSPPKNQEIEIVVSNITSAWETH